MIQIQEYNGIITYGNQYWANIGNEMAWLALTANVLPFLGQYWLAGWASIAHKAKPVFSVANPKMGAGVAPLTKNKQYKIKDTFLMITAIQKIVFIRSVT